MGSEREGRRGNDGAGNILTEVPPAVGEEARKRLLKARMLFILMSLYIRGEISMRKSKETRERTARVGREERLRISRTTSQGYTTNKKVSF